jgi:hypothetical protein
MRHQQTANEIVLNQLTYGNRQHAQCERDGPRLIYNVAREVVNGCCGRDVMLAVGADGAVLFHDTVCMIKQTYARNVSFCTEIHFEI